MHLDVGTIDPPERMTPSIAEIRELWRSSPSGDMNPGGGWLDELQYYFNRGILHIGLRLEKLERASRALPPEAAAECAEQCSDLRRELAVCSAVATALFTLETRANNHNPETATS